MGGFSELIVFVFLGALVGAAAYGFLGDNGPARRVSISLGVVGSLFGSLLLGLIGVAAFEWPGRLLVVAAGACFPIFIAERVRNRRPV